MTFIPSPTFFQVGDRVVSTRILSINQGSFTGGHEFVIKSIKKGHDPRDGAWVTYELQCPETFHRVYVYYDDHIKKKT